MSRLTTNNKINREILRQSTLQEYRDKNALNKLNTEFKQYRFVSFDVETIGRNNDFYLCGIIDYNGVYTCYYDKQEAIDYLRRLKHNDLIVVATNLMFDYSVLFKDSVYFNESNFIVNKGRCILIDFKGTYNKIRFYDTLNYGGMSVEKLGKILNKKKLDKPSCLGRKPKNKKEKQELEDYNKRDCEISRDFMIMLQETVNSVGGELKATISSTSLDIYRRKFMPYALTRESISVGLNIKSKIYSAYYGGRTEVFKRGFINSSNAKNFENSEKNNKVWFFGDINSLYPSVMLNKFPVPDSMMYESGTDKSLLDYEGVSFFKLEIPYNKYPFLPYRQGNKLLFPYGCFSGYYTHLEIRHAIKLYGENIIKDMKDTVYYTKTDYLFKDFIMFMYNKRLEDKEKSVFWKTIMNSLYGKFGTKSIDNTSFFIATNEDIVNEKINKAGSKANFNIKKNEISYFCNSVEYDGIYSMPILSCYVSAYARIVLHNNILKYSPVYVDTDSVITQDVIVDSKKLGELKLEKIIYEGIIVKPKLYFVNDEIKVKGVRIPKDVKDKERLKNNILNGKPVHYEKFVKIKEGVKRNLVVNSIIVVEKNISLEDDKRDWKGQKFSEFELQDSEPLEVHDE